MAHLIYIANVRMPSEKANAYQIMQMCEAFAQEGQQVRLIVPRRRNDQPELQHVDDVWEYYGIEPVFDMVRLPCIDLIWLLNNRIAFWLQTLTFILALWGWLIINRVGLVFTRDPLVMTALLWRFPRAKLIYEVHHKFRSERGKRLQGWLMQRVGVVVSLTHAMANQLIAMGADPDCVMVAHDGIRLERFTDVPSREATRQQIGIAPHAFVVCYAGRLHTMNMGKGLDVLVQAADPETIFLLVGGPVAHVAALRDLWQERGLPAGHFVAVGSVPPVEVPRYLVAADVCVITSPRNEFFAHETSPMKLFEYMMAGRAIIASDLPSTREVVRHQKSAYLIPPSDVGALVDALNLLRHNAALRENLGSQAKQDVKAYTWQARAARILRAAGVR